MANVGLIGSSASFRAVLDEVDMVASTNSTVLIQGETGTGKEVIAQAIHSASSRRNNQFVAVNCAAIPSTLLESELFGHERGAFTGAIAQKVGRFQVADRGTLFLDEIGDLPLELQPKLLRALQEKQFERLGGGHSVRIDARVIAATNQDLWRMVQERKFRADLYYRLNVFPIALPPLRERRDDIAALAQHFVQEFATQQGKTIEAIPDEVMGALEQHDWPGNVRELQNVIERCVIMTTGRVLTWQTTENSRRADAMAARLPEIVPRVVTTLADAERSHIVATLRETNWIVGGSHGAAARLGLPRTTLIARMQRLGISSGLTRGRSVRSTGRFVRMIGGLSSHLKDDSQANPRVVEAIAG